MNRRHFLRQAAGAATLALGATPSSQRTLFATRDATPPGLADLGLPEVTIAVDDAGFAVPMATTAGRVLMTVENAGTKDMHFFAARVPDEVSDEQLGTDLQADAEPAWFDMATLAMFGNPDWPAPGGRARGVVDVSAGRWLLVDPIGGRAGTIWTVGEPLSRAATAEPAADVEITLLEMAFTGLEQPVAAGPRVWKIANRGVLEHEIAFLPVAAGTTVETFVQQLTGMLDGTGDAASWQPAGGQGIASKGVTSWQEFDLAPGSYAAVCMTPSSEEGFVPHALMGMVQTFTVH